MRFIQIIFVVVLILAIALVGYQTISKEEAGIPFGMRFPPTEKICDYKVVTFWWRQLLDENGDFDSTVLDKARSCGTKVLVRLSGLSKDMLNDNGKGLNLHKYEENVRRYSGKIDPYVDDGTILAHLTIDEPHDCANDWGGVCPIPDEIEESARISKKYWPNLPTMTHTVPSYASKHTWMDIDIIHFQYAFHKGPLDKFISDGLDVLEDGKVKNVSWSFQAVSGGCPRFGDCPMTPAQVEEVGKAMCATGKGLFVSFSSYNEKLLTEEMLEAIEKIRKSCED